MDLDNTITISPDNFLKTFNVNYFDDKKLIKLIKEKLKNAERIGGISAFGSVHMIDNKYVIKTMELCKNGNLVEQCNQAINGDIIYSIPNTLTGKTVLMMPFYISEMISTLLLNKLAKYTSGFLKTYSAVYDIESKEKNLYIVMEKLEELDRYSQKSYLLQLIFQMVYAIYVAQKTMKYTHYDLHAGNVMVRKIKQELKIFKIGDKYVYINTDIEPVIIDYGKNVMETPSYRLIPINGAYIRNQDFNPYYDIFSILSGLYNQTDETDLNIHIKILFSMFLRTSIEKLDKKIEEISLGGYWPNVYRLNQSSPMMPIDFLGAISTIMNSDKSIVESVLSKPGMCSSGLLVGNVKPVEYPDISFSTSVKKVEKMRETSFGPVTINFKKSNIKNIPIQYMLVKIDNNYKSLGYDFEIDCCKLDPLNVLQNNIGLSMSGPNGRTHTDFSSPLKAKDTKIPGMGYIAITKDDELVITSSVLKNYKSIITNGRMIMKNKISLPNNIQYHNFSNSALLISEDKTIYFIKMLTQISFTDFAKFCTTFPIIVDAIAMGDNIAFRKEGVDTINTFKSVHTPTVLSLLKNH